MLSAKSCAEGFSHEIGHTLDLQHDGRNSPSEGYYRGHGDWAPIMGVGYYEPVSQWSRGEYNSANNQQDDLAIISGTKFGLGYRTDDHGNGLSTATALTIASTGAVSGTANAGIIERTTDLDFFSFSTRGGAVSININTVSRHGDLDILARLYDQAGNIIGTSNPAGLNASFSQNLAAGRYFISIDGTGVGNPLNTGYSDYASLGSFFISGNIPPAVTTTNQLPTVSITSPANNAAFNAPANFAITASASDVDGSIAKVEFYRGTTKLGEDATSPYSFSVANLGAGNYSLTAVATDNAGGTRTSSAVTVVVTQVATAVVATVYKHCDYSTAGYAIGLEEKTYTTAQLQALGVLDNDVSSLKVNAGYEIFLYELDNFQGRVISYKADMSCVVADGFNDITSSIAVRKVVIAPTCSTPTNLASSNVTASSATISCAAQNGASEYLMLWRELGTPWDMATRSAVSTSNTYALTGLKSTTRYEFTISVRCNGVYTNLSPANYGSFLTSAVAAVNNCSNTPQYAENAGYVAGSRVQNAGNMYQCRPWPNSGWCNGAAWAYAPGTGLYASDAWTLVQSCAAAASARSEAESEAATLSTSIIASPVPADEEITIKAAGLASANAQVQFVNMYGQAVIDTMVPVSGAEINEHMSIRDLTSGTYVVRIIDGNAVRSIKVTVR
jgi:hypothetical protein